ncbi:tripartite tricarboxylate transporter TctB family protein [Celeribacter baekdonensis]|uniref:Tripartite tricarboxylate transporter TctB family protein n=2 Tax=Celeribacter baekdonensis TaxID=875171 RepID=A0A2R4LXI9_9RHOB|nr:tripartite tricarboxylate transporter TctB family protein [Celeribacter baekdonensis]AVW89644.1 tripartite tricarboxylate transporter TctB family protein [Celeribacter baekdonensis]AVW89958.1 tripartite tricarboxylate transporter TctB family protein [Celeribacter baekdonensis]
MQDHVHHHDSTRDGSSDATPGGIVDKRRPGELVFTACLVIFSGVLLWNAYGISGFEALSGAGSVPMATAAVMLISVVIVFWRTVKLSKTEDETVMEDITPPLVIILALFLVAYGILLKPLGFLPTSALFLIASIKLLSKRSWGFTLLVSLGSLLAIYLVFRIVFTVLMPAGIVPEAEMLQLLRNLFKGGA